MADILTTSARMKTIGIIGGVTDVATAEYYKQINASIKSQLGNFHTAKIIINSVDFAPLALFIREQRWTEGAQILKDTVATLETAGSDVIICGSNTWHQCADEFMAGAKVPLLHICDSTASAIKAKGLSKVALLGTKATMSGTYISEYLTREHGLEIITPTGEQQDTTDQIIFGELAKAIFTEKSRQVYLDVIDDLHSRGAEGVILGCTEIPLLVKQSDRPGFPMFDTLVLHAEAAVEFALQDIMRN